MKAKLLERRSFFDKSFMAEKHSQPHFITVWHYHPALELVYILKSAGTRFIGDSIQKFEQGELVLVGENLPHSWQNDDIYFTKDPNLVAEAYVVHMKKDFAGETFLTLPEMQSIKILFERASQGIKFLGNSKKEAKKRMEQIVQADGFRRFILLMEFLNDLAQEPNYELLSTQGFSLPYQETGDDRIDKVYSFVLSNFKREVSLEEVASLVSLNPTAFCRYFKKSTRKTFSRFLNEIRIGFACRLLLEKKLNISEVCYECGFNNLSNFNRQFKSVMQLSPSHYLKMHRIHT